MPFSSMAPSRRKVVILPRFASCAHLIMVSQIVTPPLTRTLPPMPHKYQFRVINTSNAVFLRDVVSVQGGVELMVALGFREDSDGHLVLPMVRQAGGQTEIDRTIKDITLSRFDGRPFPCSCPGLVQVRLYSPLSMILGCGQHTLTHSASRHGRDQYASLCDVQEGTRIVSVLISARLRHHTCNSTIRHPHSIPLVGHGPDRNQRTRTLRTSPQGSSSSTPGCLSCEQPPPRRTAPPNHPKTVAAQGKEGRGTTAPATQSCRSRANHTPAKHYPSRQGAAPGKAKEWRFRWDGAARSRPGEPQPRR